MEEKEDIFEQLKEFKEFISKEDEQPLGLTKDQVESFVINRAGDLVNNTLKMLKDQAYIVQSSNDAESVESYASLANAAAQALEILNKHVIQDKKGQVTLTTKALSLSAADVKENNKDSGITREELMQLITTKVKENRGAVIDINE